jgi:nucleotidyltransferase/DNA polymerase involved in DNA repair
VAKVASRLGKPDGLLLVAPGEERTFLAPLGVGLLFGVGPRSTETLRAHGIVTIGDLASAEDTWLRRSFGMRGPEMKARAQGIDLSPVEPHRESKSISSETTLALDTGDEKVLTGKLHRLVSEVVESLRAEGLRSRTVFIKLRLADFETMTRQRTLLAPTEDPEVVLAVATDLLKKELQPGRKFRLVGVGLSNLHEEGQLPLFTM